jgi:hypothetical protein
VKIEILSLLIFSICLFIVRNASACLPVFVCVCLCVSVCLTVSFPRGGEREKEGEVSKEEEKG